LNELIAVLEQNKILIQTMVVYGSYSKGMYDEWSDIDIAVVSDAFEGNRFLDREKIRKLCFRIDPKLSPMPYNPKDFIEDDILVKEIMKTGVRIR